jgi:PAS domain S-box-containing protein
MIRGQLGTLGEPGPFGTLLRELRASSGLTQADLAELAGLSVRGISDLERGARKAPHPHTVRQLAAAMQLTDVQVGVLLAAARRGAPPDHGDAEAAAPESPDPARLALLKSTPTAVAAFDVEGRLTTLNGAAEQLFGVSSQQALGRLYTTILGPSLSDRLVGLFLHTARSGDPSQTREVRASLPSGRQVILRAAVGPLCDPRGRLLGVLLVAEDRTPDAEAVAELQEGEATSRSRRLYQALQRYLGETVALQVDTHPSFASVGGLRKTVSLLHGDVRSYTTVVETLPPEEAMHMLLRYHGAAVAALRALGATLDRFIGDSILAFWNAPNPQADHARLALSGALALQVAARAVGSELTYGVGVHTGEVVVGNLGTSEYMNYTAVGDTVNVAARLQSAAAAGEVLCSAAALEQAGGGVRATHLGELVVKGRAQPVDAYRVHELAV